MSFQNGCSFGTISRFEASLACPISCDTIREDSKLLLLTTTDCVANTPNLDKLSTDHSPWQQTQVHTIAIQESLPVHNNVACPLNNEAEYQQFPIALPFNQLDEAAGLDPTALLSNDDSFDFSEYIKFDEDDDGMDEPHSAVSSQSDVDTETSEESASSPDAPFACPDCGKQFSRYRDYARRHKRIHEGQKATYECDLCQKKFGRMDSLQRHLQKKACPKLKEKNIRIVPTDPTSYDRAF